MGEPWLRDNQQHRRQQENENERNDHHEEPGIDRSHTRLDHESLSFHWCADPGASIADQASIRSSSRAAKQGGTRRTRWDGKAKLYALVPRRSAACRRRAAGPRRGWSLDCCPVVVLGAMPSAGLPGGAVNPTRLVRVSRR